MIDVNTCFLGDCLDIMRDMPDKCIDLVLTDPPYGIGISNKVGGDKPFGSKKTRIGGVIYVKQKITFHLMTRRFQIKYILKNYGAYQKTRLSLAETISRICFRRRHVG